MELEHFLCFMPGFKCGHIFPHILLRKVIKNTQVDSRDQLIFMSIKQKVYLSRASIISHFYYHNIMHVNHNISL